MHRKYTPAAAMQSKLSSYAQNYLPGGIYWDPEPKIKEILAELDPSNDLCESILGLNDYLNTAIPNMHQVTRSNLIKPFSGYSNYDGLSKVML